MTTPHPNQDQQRLIEGLCKVFATSKTMTLNLASYSYNVIDPRFRELHELFCEGLKEMVHLDDRIAKRLRSLDVLVPATPSEFTKISLVQDHPGLTDANAMLQNLLIDGQTFSRFVLSVAKTSDELQDWATLNMLSEIEECVGKFAWKVKSLLGQPQVNFEHVKGLTEIAKVHQYHQRQAPASAARGQQTTTATH